jgi:hypothetical protein
MVATSKMETYVDRGLNAKRKSSNQYLFSEVTVKHIYFRFLKLKEIAM